MTASDYELLRRFAHEGAQDAFTLLVNRYLNLVYSAALRQVRSREVAEEVSQSVFAQLACHAGKLGPGMVLSAWLYQVTRNAAIDAVRKEARRQAREQLAVQMTTLNDNGAEWSHIEPFLDEAMESLGEADRTAVLLRYFENKSLREVGDALGATEDAAQKRVTRALERLRAILARRKVAVSSATLAALLSANACSAVPPALFATLAAGAAAAAGTAVATPFLVTPATATVLKTISMTTLQKAVLAALVIGGVGLSVYQAREASQLKEQVRALQAEQQQYASLSNRAIALQQERDEARTALANLKSEQATTSRGPNEVLKLRGEVGRLRQENVQIGSSSALSKVTANPEARKMLRDQQKLGMTVLYRGFAKDQVPAEKTEQFHDLLADHIMENVNHVTTALRDKLSVDEMTRLFTAQDAVLSQQLEGLLGPESFGRYQEYTKDLLSNLSAEQFKGMLTGSEQEKAEKSGQFRKVLHEASRAALTEAGLAADYQTVPILNFVNIASEQEGERSIKLMESIYDKAASQAGSFLSPEEMKKLQEFKAAAVKNNRTALTLNRTMMAPIAQ